jgi:predicted alpha/beta superfamily hydrolase
VVVRYPAPQGDVVLRSEQDWDLDIEAVEVSPSCCAWTFEIESESPYIYFKPCLRLEGETIWSRGTNYLLILTKQKRKEVWPFFYEESQSAISPMLECESSILDEPHLLRVYTPPGYHENTLKNYGVLYMLDGKNLFFPDEAFLGNTWDMQENLDLLNLMNAIDKVLIVGIYSKNRNSDYTQPGYEKYGRSLAREVKPWVDGQFRTLREPENTGVMGSSLGGVASFFLAWQFPEVFGFAACLSSTFSWRDDLIDRVLSEEKRDVKIYLDSGWPGDNYEVTRAMAQALLEKGFVFGSDFLYFAFPMADHSEGAWSSRVHQPVQLFSGKLPRSSRDVHPRVRRSLMAPAHEREHPHVGPVSQSLGV